MKKLWLIVLCLTLVPGIAGCNKSASGKDAEKIAIRGQITKVTQNPNNKSVTLLIEGKIEQDTGYDKSSVTVNSDTKIIKANSKDKLSMEDLKVGMKVEVYYDGPVLESYPVQMGANIIKVLQ